MPAMTPGPHAQRVLAGAVEESTQLDHPYVGTEHLLLALLRDSDGGAGAVLTALAVRRDAVQKMVMTMLEPGDATVPPWKGPRPYTSRAQQVLTLAEQAAVALGQTALGTEHLLLGLTAEGQGIGGQVLLVHGVSSARAHEATVRWLRGGVAAPPLPPSSPAA